jgi:hypothetical protein
MRAHLAPSLSATSIAAGKLEYHLGITMQQKILMGRKDPEAGAHRLLEWIKKCAKTSKSMSSARGWPDPKLPGNWPKQDFA